MNFLGKAGRILDRIMEIFSFIAGLFLAFILLSVCLEVFMRYFLNRPLQWVVELTEYALLYITFLGTAWLLKKGGHINVDIFLSLLSSRTRTGLQFFSSLIGIIVSFCLVWYGFLVSWEHYQDGIYNITLLEFPKAPLLAIIPIGSLILLAQFIRRAYGSLVAFMGKKPIPEN
jgi:TRAP-type C4-dicarboxylate transport system permease small subunit